MKITDTIRYAGVNDHQVDLFEGQYKVPNGMSYNSYVILDDKIAVMDTVDANFTHEWLDNIQQILDGRKPDYLIVQHMEPDHAANVANFLKVYPDTTVVSNKKAFNMIHNFFDLDLDGPQDRSRKRRYTFSWISSAYFCLCSDGTLAGSYGDL